MLLRAGLLSSCLVGPVVADPYPPQASYADAGMAWDREAWVNPLSTAETEHDPVPLSRNASSLPASWQSVVDLQTKREGLPAHLVLAVIAAESAGNPNAVSDRGAVGLMQLMPDTAERFGVARDERRDPIKSILGGTRYLGWLYRHFHGDIRKTVAAYNCGETCVEARGIAEMPLETRVYVGRVLRWLRG